MRNEAALKLVRNTVCSRCNNRGLNEACPKCGKIKNSLLTTNSEEEVRLLNKKSDFALIPEFYRTREFRESTFWEYHTEPAVSSSNYYDSPATYVRNVLEFQETFKKGLPTNRSHLIFSPTTYGKWILTYSCMQYALKYDFSVAPLLDTLEWARLLISGSTNSDFKLMGRLSYDSLIDKQIMFVKVTNTYMYSDSHQVIRELLSIRSRLGLNTHFVSSVTPKNLGLDDSTGNYDRMIKMNGPDNDPKKYLRFIGYRG